MVTVRECSRSDGRVGGLGGEDRDAHDDQHDAGDLDPGQPLAEQEERRDRG